MDNTRQEFEAMKNYILKVKDCTKCINCGSTDNIELHHIVPLIVGGTNNINNIVPVCEECHNKIHECNRQSKMSKLGMKKSAEKGNINTKLFGYKLEENKLVIVQEEAKIVKLIFKLYIEGYGSRRISNYLNECNIKTQQNKNFSPTAVLDIISNEKYKGTSIRNKCYRDENGKINLNDENEWVIYNYGDILPNGEVFDKIPPIVTKQVFDKAQNIKQNRIKNGKGYKKGNPVIMIDKNTNKPIAVFNSQVEASQYVNVAKQSISNAINGKYKSCCGYKWKYINIIKL